MLLKHGIQMLLNGLAAVNGRVALQGINDPQMRGDRKLPPLCIAQFRRTPGDIKFVQMGHGSGQQAVSRAKGQAVVKTGVQVAVFLPGQQAALLVTGDDLQAVKLFGGVAMGPQER